MLTRIKILFFLLTISSFAHADITLPKLISDGMVLQRDTKINIWGWASKGEKVSVKFNGKSYNTTATSDGSWHVSLAPLKAGGPYSMTITGKNSIIIKDIMIGDVWFCSGQSNMVINMERVKEKYPDEITSASYPAIRNFLVPTYSDVAKVRNDLPGGKWVVTTPQTIYEFGAVAYFFAKAIYSKYKVPIGIINSSVGGTPAEAWVSEEGLNQFPDFSSLVKKFKDSTYLKSLMPPANTRKTEYIKTRDVGISEKWYDTLYVPKGWHSFWLPGYWDDQGVKNLHGNVWFRREINLSSEMASTPAKLFLGRIIDADETYVNGVKVGNITYQYPPRRYNIPAGLLKSGKNVIVVRVTNTNGKGGFVPDKPYHLLIGDKKIDLRGDWSYKVGEVFPNTPPPPPAFSAQNSPTGLYNTMVAPITPYTIRGFNWYQGETNSNKPENYSPILSSLINDWRRKWNLGELPFSFVQLPNFMEVQYSPMESKWAELRDQQRKTLTVPNTAMTVGLDLGEWNDIHPLIKKEVGERLALAAEHLSYKNTSIVYSGPLYQSHAINDNAITLTFSNVGGGLISKGDEDLHYFEIAGADHKYFQARATIKGDKVVVWSDDVKTPVSVRYAWADNPENANLYNKEGLPASPFQTEK